MKEKKLRKRRVLVILFVVFVVLLLFTWLVVLEKFYFFSYSANIELHPRFSLPNVLSKILSQIGLFVIIIFSFIVGIVFSIIGFGKKTLERLTRGEKECSITDALWSIIKENFLECLLLFLITIVILFNLATFIEDISRTSPASLIPTLIALFLSIISIGITTIGIYYAFLAERKSDAAQRNSLQLIKERGDFLEHFSGFIKRINRKIEGQNRKLDNFESRSESFGNVPPEKHLYYIKCMFLTPFLGHAGIIASDEDTYHEFANLQINLSKLIVDPYCKVQILTLEKQQLVCWYAQIQWVEHVNEEMNQHQDKKKFSQFTNEQKNEIISKTKTSLRNKGLESLTMNESRESLHGFNQLAEGYKLRSDFLGKLEIAHTDYIPFQMLLVTEVFPNDPMNIKEFPKNSQSLRNDLQHDKETKQLIEECKFAVLTFVGDQTYYKLCSLIISDSKNYPENGGIKNLLNNLHSAFYSEDPRLCKILNNHFKHYWEQALVFGNTCKHYPEFDAEVWQNVDVDGCIKSNKYRIYNRG